MNEEIIKEFFQLLDDACDAIGKPRKTESAKMLFLDVVGEFGLSNLKGALMAHLRDPERGRFVPSPADLIEQIQRAMQKDGRPSADEAWAIAVQMIDENTTVVSNDEISQAWGVAVEVMPDRTGARMAFRSAYDRLVAEARQLGRPVKWFPSLGHDKHGREPALKQAADLGRLTHEHVNELLPAPEPKKQSIPAIEHKPTDPQQAMKYLADIKAKMKKIS